MNNVKIKDMVSTTIRCPKDVVDKYVELYGNYYRGAETAARIFPTLRQQSLDRIKKHINRDDFEDMTYLLEAHELVDYHMTDIDIMISLMNKKQKEEGYNINTKRIYRLIKEIGQPFSFFLFEEIRRYFKFLQDLPEFSPKEYYDYEM